MMPEEFQDSQDSIERDKRIDELCDRFEHEHQAGRQPDLRIFALEIEPQSREQLLRELVAIDAHYRRQSGLVNSWEYYQALAPSLTEEEFQRCVALSRLNSSTLAFSNSRTQERQSDEPMDLPCLVGDYDLLRPIARGGMGIVYLARQRSLNRLVAIKFILAGHLASREEVERFVSEAQAAALLDHPGIVPIFEVGAHAGRHYYSMAYIDGPSLSTKLNACIMDGPQAAQMLSEICEAIQYAHEQGIIHRDLKPSNILIDAHGKSRVTDFGLAKRLTNDTDITLSGQILGTPSFMSPEQAAGGAETIGPATDIYSLGAVLYCMTTGRPPFQAASSLDTLRQVTDKEPVPPRELNPFIPLDVETIILRCLDKSPNRRFATARELRDELQRFLNGQPIQSRRISRIERLHRWSRREPRVAGLLFLLLSVLTAGVIISGRFAWSEHEARLSEQKQKDVVIRQKEVVEQKQIEAERSNLAAKAATEAAEKARENEAAQATLARNKSAQLARSLFLSDMKQVESSIENGQTLRASELLDRHVPKEGETDLRSFEWYYLDGIVRPKFPVWSLGKPIEVMACSPDESLIAIGCTGGQAYVLDLQKGDLRDLVYTIDDQHWSSITIVGSNTEPRLFACGNTGQLRVWNLNSGNLEYSRSPKLTYLEESFEKAKDRNSLSKTQPEMLGSTSAKSRIKYPSAVDPTGKWLVGIEPEVASRFFRGLALWSTTDWTAHEVPCLNDGTFRFPGHSITVGFFLPHSNNSVPLDKEDPAPMDIQSIRRMAEFALDGYSNQHMIQPSLSGMFMVPRGYSTLSMPVSKLRFHPFDDILASANNDGTITVWDLAGAIDPRRWVEKNWTKKVVHQRPIRDLSFSPSGSRLLTVDVNGQWLISNTEHLKTIARGFEASSLEEGVWLDDENIVLLRADGTVTVVNPMKQKSLMGLSPTVPCKHLLALPKSATFLVSDAAGQITRCKLPQTPTSLAFNTPVHDLYLTGNSRFLTCMSVSGGLYTFDRTKATNSMSPMPRHLVTGSTFISAMQQSTDVRSHWAVPNENRFLRFVGQTLQSIDMTEQSISWSYDLPYLHTHPQVQRFLWQDGRIIPVPRGQEHRKQNGAFGNSISFCELSPQGKRLLVVLESASETVYLCLLNLEAGKCELEGCISVEGTPQRLVCSWLDEHRILLLPATMAGSSMTPSHPTVWNTRDQSFHPIQGLENLKTVPQRGSLVHVASNRSSFAVRYGQTDVAWLDCGSLELIAAIKDPKWEIYGAYATNDRQLFAYARNQGSFGPSALDASWLRFDNQTQKWVAQTTLPGALASSRGRMHACDVEEQVLFVQRDEDHLVNQWDLRNGTLRDSIWVPDGSVFSLAESEKGKLAAILKSTYNFGFNWASGQTHSLVLPGRPPWPLSPHSGIPFVIPLKEDVWLTSQGIHSSKTTVPSGDWIDEITKRAEHSLTTATQDSNQLVQIQSDGTCVHWLRFANGPNELYKKTMDFQAPIKGIIKAELSRDGSRLAILSPTEVAWCQLEGPQWHILPKAAPEDAPFSAFAWSQRADRLVIGNTSGSVMVHDCASDQKQVFGTAQPGPIDACVWLPGDLTFATGGADGSIVFWDPVQRDTRLKLKEHLGAVRTLQLSRDEKSLISSGDDGLVRRLYATQNPTGELQSRQLKLPQQLAKTEVFVEPVLAEQNAETKAKKWLLDHGIRPELQFGSALKGQPEDADYDDPHYLVHSLHLSNRTYIGDSEAKILAACRSLKSLRLDGTSLTLVGLLELDLRHAHTLDLSGIDLSEVSVSELEVGTNLRRLVLANTHLSDKQLMELVQLCPELTILDVRNNPITDQALVSIAKLSKLTDLNLSGTDITGKCAPFMATLPTLFFLDLSKTKFRSLDAIEPLKTLRKLQRLTLPMPTTSESWQELCVDQPDRAPVWPVLRELKLTDGRLSLDNLEALAKSRGSVLLDVDVNTENAPHDLQILLAIKSWIYESQVEVDNVIMPVSAAISALQQGGALTAIYDKIPAANDEERARQLSLLTSLKKLECLQGVSSLGYSNLAQIPQLRKLHIERNEKLAGIEQMKQITHLVIRTDDSQLGKLHELPELQSLYFDDPFRFPLAAVAKLKLNISELKFRSVLKEGNMALLAPTFPTVETLELQDTLLSAADTLAIFQMKSLKVLRLKNVIFSKISLPSVQARYPQIRVERLPKTTP